MSSVSSANNVMLLRILYLTSLTSIKNSKVSKIEPLGTPADIGWLGEALPFSTTLSDQLVRYFSNGEIKVAAISNCLPLNSNPSCNTLSKASDTTRIIGHTSLPESRD
jgi:hypothetical protein